MRVITLVAAGFSLRIRTLKGAATRECVIIIPDIPVAAGFSLRDWGVTPLRVLFPFGMLLKLLTLLIFIFIPSFVFAQTVKPLTKISLEVWQVKADDDINLDPLEITQEGENKVIYINQDHLRNRNIKIWIRANLEPSVANPSLLNWQNSNPSCLSLVQVAGEPNTLRRLSPDRSPLKPEKEPKSGTICRSTISVRGAGISKQITIFINKVTNRPIPSEQIKWLTLEVWKQKTGEPPQKLGEKPNFVAEISPADLVSPDFTFFIKASARQRVKNLPEDKAADPNLITDWTSSNKDCIILEEDRGLPLSGLRENNEKRLIFKRNIGKQLKIIPCQTRVFAFAPPFKKGQRPVASSVGIKVKSSDPKPTLPVLSSIKLDLIKSKIVDKKEARETLKTVVDRSGSNIHLDKDKIKGNAFLLRAEFPFNIFKDWEKKVSLDKAGCFDLKQVKSEEENTLIFQLLNLGIKKEKGLAFPQICQANIRVIAKKSGSQDQVANLSVSIDQFNTERITSLPMTLLIEEIKEGKWVVRLPNRSADGSLELADHQVKDKNINLWVRANLNPVGANPKALSPFVSSNPHCLTLIKVAGQPANVLKISPDKSRLTQEFLEEPGRICATEIFISDAAGIKSSIKVAIEETEPSF